MNELPIFDENVFVFDARGIAKRFRHAAIFGALESLGDGETMRFVNDHDPLPLLNQIGSRYGQQIALEYRQCEAGNIVIDFVVTLGEHAQEPAAVAGAPAGAGCGGGGGGGCGCSHR